MDLSGLTDDQLLQLIQAAMAETVLRGEAIAYAANQTVSDAAQELRDRVAKAEATGRAATARSTSSYEASDKAALIQSLIESSFFATYRYDQFGISIWEKRGEVRVYIQQSFVGDPWKFAYFHTGNAWSSPRTMDSADGSTATSLIPLCKAICERHIPGFKCYSNDLKKASPDPQALEFYRQAINKVHPTI
ncbi:hypothetical protein [Chamaesiphon sp.]|uniref:hypothetical protein n=1 Tax=Chamaesiphon sp. TaxID=2814140 RepID=UPI003593F6B8